MEDSTKKSTTRNTRNVRNPARILPIADAEYEKDLRRVGIMYKGNDFDQESAWITCGFEDLKLIEQ